MVTLNIFSTEYIDFNFKKYLLKMFADEFYFTKCLYLL